jgi:hypothetical protein
LKERKAAMKSNERKAAIKMKIPCQILEYTVKQ